MVVFWLFLVPTLHSQANLELKCLHRLSSELVCFVRHVIVSSEHHQTSLPLFFSIKASHCLPANVLKHMQEILSWFWESIAQETISMTLPFVWHNGFWQIMINAAILYSEDWKKFIGNSEVADCQEPMNVAEKLHWHHHTNRK